MGRLHGAVIVVGALTLAACGGTELAAPEPVTEATESPVPTVNATLPDELALLDSELRLEGDVFALVRPGEAVEIDHLLYNRAGTARSVTFRVRNTELDVELALTSLRVGSEETLGFTSTVTIPESAEVGDTLSYEVLAAVSSDTDQQDVTTVELVVADVEGERPAIGPRRAQTNTNEKVTLFVLAGVTDRDDDLDFSSLEIVAGGFKAADVTAGPDGTIVYVPFRNITGQDRVLYQLCDSEQRCDTDVITIEVDG